MFTVSFFNIYMTRYINENKCCKEDISIRSTEKGKSKVLAMNRLHEEE